MNQTTDSVIRAEYQRLCNVLGLTPVPLDIYIYVSNPDTDAETATAFGTSLRNATPCYSGTKRIIILPMCDGDEHPERLPPFPPFTWLKHDDAWPVWRIELWHEVVHQVSNDLLSSWNPKEPGRARADQTVSDMGHGVGWFQGVCRVASVFAIDPDLLDRLLDR